VTAPCDWCLTNSGRTHATRPCCVLRRLAQAPRHAQAEHAQTLTVAERDALRPLLKAEIQRLKEMK